MTNMACGRSRLAATAAGTWEEMEQSEDPRVQQFLEGDVEEE